MTDASADGPPAGTALEDGWASDGLMPPGGGRWDLLVIGGGTAGLVAAKTAAGFGATVLLVERDRLGGDCLWTGCVPSKALLAAAHAAHDARAARRLGVRVRGVDVDFGAVMAHVGAAIAAIEPTDSPAALRAAGVAVVHGTATFTGAGTAAVDGAPVAFAQALIATGSGPHLPDIPGLADAAALTNETVFTLDELPPRLLVLGGGSIGCELGQAFGRLGSAVTIVESGSRLLAREDADAAALVRAALVADGVTVRTGGGVSAVQRTDAGWTATLADGDQVGFDRMLVAVGRAPSTAGLGLETVGVELDDRGYVRVDDQLRTTNPRIRAAGDLTGYPQFTHTAGVHGSVAAANAVLGLRRTVDLATNPRVTFTQPELAAFGVGLEQARRRRLTVHTVSHRDIDRAVAEADTAGFTRLVLDRRQRVVGATIVGPRAGESLAEVVLAAEHGLRARDIASATHAYPTYGDGVWNAAIEQVQHQLATGAPHTLVRIAAALRHRWVSR